MTKAPGRFRKPIKAKVFEKWAKQLENASDKNFFVGSFIKQTDAKQKEVFVLKEGLEEADNKRLKKILKTIKTNQKSSVRAVPLVFAAAIVGAIVVFFVMFANPILGTAAEKGLEAAFNGKSNVYNFRLFLGRQFGMTISKVTVADQNSPMTNLFELGPTKIVLDTNAILRGKVYINTIESNNIQFGTPRKTSGALPYKPPKEKPPKPPKAEAPPMIDFKNFDANALLEREYDKLTSPKLYDEAAALYDETYTKWKKQVDDAQKQVEAVQKASEPILKLNANSFTDMSKIPQTVQDITKMIDTTKKASETATKLANDLEGDIKKAKALEQNARNAVNSDIALLKSYVDLGSGAAFAALEPSIREVLSGTAEKYMDYGLMALDALGELKAKSAEKEAAKTDEQRQKEKEAKEKKAANKAEKARLKAEKKAALAGRDVAFPTRSYPSFYLGKFASDITVGSWTGAFNLSNVSSDPDLFPGGPVTLDISATENNLNQAITFKGNADFTSQGNGSYTANVTGSGFPVALGKELEPVGVKGFKGVATMTANVSGDSSSTTIGSDIKILQAQVLEPSGTLAEAVATAVKQVGQINMGIEYASQGNKFELKTNLAELINNAMKAAAAGYAKQAMDELEKVVRAKMAQYIDGKFVSSDDLDNLLKLAKGDKAAMDQISKSLDSKKAEFEKKAADEAKKQGAQAAQDLLKGNTPNIKLPW